MLRNKLQSKKRNVYLAILWEKWLHLSEIMKPTSNMSFVFRRLENE